MKFMERKLNEKKDNNLVWSSNAQQDYYFGMDKEELINEIESMDEVEDFLRIRGYDDIEEADEDELRSFLLSSDIDLDYEDFTESVMPMIKEQCANDVLVLWGRAANWRGAYDAGAVIDVDEFKNYIYPDYDAISEIRSDNGNLYYIQYSHDTPTGGDTMYLYSFKSDELYDNACRICDSKDDNGDIEWLGEFKDDAGYAEIAEAIELGYLTPVTNRFNEGLEDSLQERNLTKAERHNRDMERIFNYKKATDNAMKDFLVKNGVSKDDAENLHKQDKLDNKLRDMGLHDMFFDDYLKNESLNEGRYSDYADDETRANGWWYFTTHGVGPGSIPKDLNVLEVKEGQNKKGTWGDYVRLDGILNTDELDYYDMIELAPVEEEEDFSGFFSDYDFEESLGEEATSNKKFTIKYGKGRPGGDSEVVEFPSAKEAGRYAADHAKGWGFEVTPFDESLNESEEYKTLAKLSKGLEVISYPYGYAVTDGYVNDRLTVNGDTYVLDDGRFKLSDTDKIKINNLIRKGIIKSSTNESLNEDVREVWQVCDLYSGQPIDDYETEEMAKNEAAYLQQMKDEGMFIPWDGPFVVNKTYKRFDESLSEDKTPYGDTTIEDYVSANFSGSDEDKQKFVAEMKKKASGKDYFNGLNMSVKDWEKAGKQFGLSMKKNPVTEDVTKMKDRYSSSDLQRAVESALSRFGFDYEHGYSLDFIPKERGSVPYLEVECADGFDWKDYSIIERIFSRGPRNWFNGFDINAHPGKEHVDGGLLSIVFDPRGMRYYFNNDDDDVDFIEFDESLSESVVDDYKLQKGDEITLWWKGPNDETQYASVEYLGRDKDRNYKFESTTYGWLYLVSKDKSKVKMPNKNEWRDMIDRGIDVREDFNVDWENNRKAKAEVVGWWKDVEKWNKENGSKFNIDNDYSDAESMFAAIYDMLSELKTANKDLYKRGKAIYNKYAYVPIKEGKASELSEDTVKTSDGKWTNKGKEGTHGKFKTKKEADAQRRAMFANNFKG